MNRQNVKTQVTKNGGREFLFHILARDELAAISAHLLVKWLQEHEMLGVVLPSGSRHNNEWVMIPILALLFQYRYRSLWYQAALMITDPDGQGAWRDHRFSVDEKRALQRFRHDYGVVDCTVQRKINLLKSKNMNGK